MSAAVSSRQQILERIHAATPQAAATADEALRVHAALERNYTRRGSLSAPSRLELMMERLREYDAETSECRWEELPAAIGAQLTRSGRRTLVAPGGLPQEWLAPGFKWKIDRGLRNGELGTGELGVGEIERADGVLTACFCGVAESGTIVLHHTAAEGRRVLSLLPDWHLCILRASQVVQALPEYFDRCRELPSAPALVTWISGPSATADIEMTRIKGVHGPRFLNVVLVRDEDDAAAGKGSGQENQVNGGDGPGKG
jgi:L-lactate dehydrogenase complex protein LldG